jgi:hypothetical protein
MIQANHRLIRGEVLSAEEKDRITENLLAAAISMPEERHYGEEPDGKARKPLFFLPPDNGGRKLKTVMGQTPKTHILNGNMYELEILRLLCLFAPDNPIVDKMRTQTLNRLRATCFGGHGCSLGECFDAALVVLRFLTVAVPAESEWMESLIAMYGEHRADKKRVKAVEQYYDLCVSELPTGLAG